MVSHAITEKVLSQIGSWLLFLNIVRVACLAGEPCRFGAGHLEPRLGAHIVFSPDDLVHLGQVKMQTAGL